MEYKKVESNQTTNLKMQKILKQLSIRKSSMNLKITNYLENYEKAQKRSSNDGLPFQNIQKTSQNSSLFHLKPNQQQELQELIEAEQIDESGSESSSKSVSVSNNSNHQNIQNDQILFSVQEANPQPVEEADPQPIEEEKVVQLQPKELKINGLQIFKKYSFQQVFVKKAENNNNNQKEKKLTLQQLLQQKLLMEEQDNDLKFLISQEIQKNIETQERRIILKRILQIKSFKRTEDEIEDLIKELKKINFFKQREYLTNHDYRDLAQSLNYQESKPNETIIEIGEKGDTFYIILKGELSVQIPNPKIEDWQWA